MPAEVKQSLVEILARSDAYRSLQAEDAVARRLMKLRWSTTRSAYYVDPKEGKSRELDIVATSRWEKKRKHDEVWVRVHLFIEVKTNSDYHILLSGRGADVHSYGANEYWLGYCNETRRLLEQQLEKFHVPPDEIFAYMHQMERVAFPNHRMRTAVLRVGVPHVPTYSAFRETNGGKEKELDNSVLWRAALALRSAIRSSRLERMDEVARDLEGELEFARRQKEPYITATQCVGWNASRLDLYLPIVVIQSRLWAEKAGILEELRWARLAQYGASGHAQDWVDVVNFDHVSEYLKAQTNWYVRAFKRVRAKRKA